VRKLCLVTLLVAAWAAAPADAAAPNPLAGQSWFVERGEHPAWRSLQDYERAGRERSARLMWRIAREPKFRWFGRWSRPHHLRDYLAAAGREGSVALLTVMRHQGRACGGGYDGGGPAEDARTRRWYRRYARIIGGRPVVIAFEPDSLGTVDCLAAHRRGARLRLLRYGVRVFARLPGATVYLEAGASDWEPARRTARQLRFIGIRRVRGFMLNVTHFDWTRAAIRHGRRISRRVGGKPFVINTAANGRGPLHGRGANVWCNPPGRGLGIPPTADTGQAKVDAYLWISRPGFSAGACNGGPLPVGAWWPARALELARLQSTRLGPRR
jgi:endoglucanase